MTINYYSAQLRTKASRDSLIYSTCQCYATSDCPTMNGQNSARSD